MRLATVVTTTRIPHLRASAEAGQARPALMPSESVENYLKAIYQIESRSGERVKTKDVAAELNLSMPSVTSMMRSLSNQGMLDYVPYQGVRLTEQGHRAALKVIRRHRLLEVFLNETLGMTWSEVHEEAELLEHALSDKLTDRIDAFLGHPVADPHGDPIPTRDGVMPAQRGQALVGLAEDTHAVVARVLSQETAFLRYLASKGLQPGAQFVITEVAPFHGPITLQVAGRDAPVSLSVEASRLLLVEPV